MELNNNNYSVGREVMTVADLRPKYCRSIVYPTTGLPNCNHAYYYFEKLCIDKSYNITD